MESNKIQRKWGKTEFSNIEKSCKVRYIKALKNDLFPDEPDKITKLLKTIRESR